MKKYFFLVLSIGLFTTYSAMASAIIGIQVEVKKGTKEWNADHTEVLCVGKGLCEISIKATIGSPAAQMIATLGWIDGGSFGLSCPATILRDANWMDTFENGVVIIQQDLAITPDIASQIKNCPSVIKAGKYRYKQDGNSVYVYFQ